MTFENVPFEDIPNTLTLEEAAKITGFSEAYFKSVMSGLNNTAGDIRAPRTPGERARRYDGDKLAQWIKAGKPQGGSYPHTPGTTVIKGTASLGSNGWTGTIHEPPVTTAASKMPELRRSLAALAAEKLNVEVRDVVVELEIEPPFTARPHLERMRQISAQIDALTKESENERLAAVTKMRDAGLVHEEIAPILGLSTARITQLASKIKALSPAEKSRLQTAPPPPSAKAGA